MTARLMHASVDRDGRLIACDQAFAEINDAAGGAIGQLLALPALAALVQRARRLGTLISREVTIASADRDVDAWARIQPESNALRLTLSPIRERPALRSPSQRWSAPIGELAWETDAAGRVVHLSGGADALGRSIETVIKTEDDSLRTARAPITGMAARLNATGEDIRVTAIPRLDRNGEFAGFRGAADRVDRALPPGLTAQFTTRLDRALRTPLGQIIANADSIHARAEGPISDDYAGYAADIANAGRHLMSLIDDLMDLEAIEKPDFRPELEPIDLADIARRAAGLFAVRAMDADVVIDRPSEGTSLMAKGDFRRTLQVLVNLIGNAIRYAPRGTRVSISVAGDSSRGWVRVADQGKGIAAEHQALIFDKFGRVDPSEQGGNGLGLYIARKLARAMQGDLTLESREGEGAVFTLTLSA